MSHLCECISNPISKNLEAFKEDKIIPTNDNIPPKIFFISKNTAIKLNKTIGIKQYPSTLIVLYNNIPLFLDIRFNSKNISTLPNKEIP